MRSKALTLQLTVQLQPNPQCRLGHLCCTCPQTEFKKKHRQGQGQYPVQSSGALKKKHWASLAKELEVSFIKMTEAVECISIHLAPQHTNMQAGQLLQLF